ncbi:hypothetical protein MUCCIDRAFT_114775 [Mucor lusitanicus CBS 277.49]|uniref:Uncharacterized protein n=1 Tax=Mucor lusitanicus CBS 277.49 TaxID=747725 RepID=A0A168I5R7_MUCCL|nr:hypothetical protein MUCCIDRAFT_114775 [Mucor lusitanicus CBS 277.49]
MYAAEPLSVDNADAKEGLSACMKLPTTHTVGPKQISEDTGLHANQITVSTFESKLVFKCEIIVEGVSAKPSSHQNQTMMERLKTQNKELEQENKQLKQQIRLLQKENKQLKQDGQTINENKQLRIELPSLSNVQKEIIYSTPNGYCGFNCFSLAQYGDESNVMKVMSYHKALKQQKKTTLCGRRAATAEQLLSTNSLHSCSTPYELEECVSIHKDNRDAIRSFYYSATQSKKTHQLEWNKQRGQDRIASKERQALAKRDTVRVMFVGDRGHGYGSAIKGHLRFGGHWKEERHARYVPTIITNEYNSSQTCLFCFNKLSHPIYPRKNAVKVNKGTFICLHPQCPNAHVPVCRDQVSALAIGLAGMAQLLFGATFPYFNEISDYQCRELFDDQALLFLEKHEQMS